MGILWPGDPSDRHQLLGRYRKDVDMLWWRSECVVEIAREKGGGDFVVETTKKRS